MRQNLTLLHLISTFVICLLKRQISKLASRKISVFLLVSVAEQVGLSLAHSETLKTLTVKPVLRAFAGKTSHIEIFLILCIQFVLCMDCQFMK